MTQNHREVLIEILEDKLIDLNYLSSVIDGEEILFDIYYLDEVNENIFKLKSILKELKENKFEMSYESRKELNTYLDDLSIDYTGEDKEEFIKSFKSIIGDLNKKQTNLFKQLGFNHE